MQCLDDVSQLPIWHQLLNTRCQPRDPLYGMTLSQNHFLQSDLLRWMAKDCCCSQRR